MEATVGNNSFINGDYGSQTTYSSYSKYRETYVQGTYLKNPPSSLPLNNNEQVSEVHRNLSDLINVLENKIYEFQLIGGTCGLEDKFFKDLKYLVIRLKSLKDNLNLGNLKQTLAELKSLGNDNYELLQQLLKMQNPYANKKTTSVRSYMFSLYDRVNEKKAQSLGIDVYY